MNECCDKKVLISNWSSHLPKRPRKLIRKIKEREIQIFFLISSTLFLYIAYLVRMFFSYFKEWQLIKLLILVILILILRAEKMETPWHFILWNPNPCLLLAIVFPKLENFGFNHCVFKINLLQVKQKLLTICLKNVYLVRR